jgi:hypothetical protein
MAALKWLVVTVCGVCSLGLMGLGLNASTGLRSMESVTVATAKVSLRPLPAAFVPGSASVAPQAVVKPAAAEPAVALEPADAGRVKEVGVAAKPEAVAGVVVPVAKPAVVDAGVKPVAAAVVVPSTPASSVEAILNLKASETADVFVDGKRVGSSPVLGVKVKVGVHKVRFDCYDAAGNTLAGAVQTVTATAEHALDVAFTCPASE